MTLPHRSSLVARPLMSVPKDWSLYVSQSAFPFLQGLSRPSIGRGTDILLSSGQVLPWDSRSTHCKTMELHLEDVFAGRAGAEHYFVCERGHIVVAWSC